MPSSPPKSARSELSQLQFRLAATRTRLLLARTGAGVAAALAVGIGGLCAEMALDCLVHLPWLARACFALPTLGGALWLLARNAILPLLQVPGDHAMACEIERAIPSFQTRLIASIQLGRNSAARANALVGALIRETAAMAATIDFRRAVKLDRLHRNLRFLIAAVVFAVVVAWMVHPNALLLLQRALLLSARLPARTRIEKIEFPIKVAAGNDLTITVDASGQLPTSGKIEAQAGSQSSEYPLEPQPGAKNQYRALIHAVSRSFTFHAVFNDAQSDSMSITVLTPPAILSVQCTETFPAYTHLQPAQRPTGDLALLAGSHLQISIACSSPVITGTLHLAGQGSDLALTIDPKNPAQATADIPIPARGLTGFSIQVVDANGLASRDSVLYRIDIVPDHPPTAHLTHPGSAELATPTARELIGLDAGDDFGISTVALHYSVNHTAEKIIPLDLIGDTPTALRRRFDWDLSALNLQPGDRIDYWIEAIDGNDVTGPGKGDSDHYVIKLATEAEKRAELAGRTNDALSVLDQSAQTQDGLSRTLGTLIFKSPDAGNP
jgi:hypothetical protein